MHSLINVVMKQQRDGAINKAYGHTQVCQQIFIIKMSNKCTIMRRCLIFSIFQGNNFGNKG